MTSGLITLALLLLFVGGWIWAWSPKRKRGFDEAARLPLDDGEAAARRAADAAARGDRNDDAGADAGDEQGKRQ